MSIESLTVYNSQLKRNIHFDLLEDGYYCDLILNDCESCPTGIAETDNSEELKSKALMFISDTLQNKDNYQLALKSADFYPLKINNSDLIKDYSGSLLLSVKQQYESSDNDILHFSSYKSDYIKNIDVTASEQMLLDRFAIYLSTTRHNNFDTKLTEFEKRLPQKLTLRELNLARLNQRILMFNACVHCLNSDPFYDLNSIFSKDFFIKHNLNDYFPPLKKTEQLESLLDLCIDLSQKLSVEPFKKRADYFADFLKPIIVLECLKINHYASTILNNVLFPSFISADSLFLSERSLNIFFQNSVYLLQLKILRKFQKNFFFLLLTLSKTLYIRL